MVVLMNGLFVVSASATLITVVDKEAKVNEVFDVVIYCEPSEPIKSYEFNVRFDPSILSVTYLSAGDFFEGFPTFSSPNCVIDNELGTIINVYDLTVGAGLMVDEPGILVYIHCTAKRNGTSNITLYDAGVTNETRYLSLSVDDGMVTVNGLFVPESPEEPPLLPEQQPNQQNKEDPVSFMTKNIIIVLIIGFIIIFIFTRIFGG
jgi:hypothetical protein